MNVFRNTKDNTAVCDVDELEFWVPLNYFSENNEESLAQLSEDSVTLTAIFPIRFRKTDGKWTIKSFIMGATVTIRVNESRQENKSIAISDEPADYMVFSYYRGDTIFASTSIIQSSSAYADAIKMITSGKVPKRTRYSDIPEIARTAAEVNGQSLGIPTTLMHALIGAQCRSPDMKQPFRMTKAFQNGSETGFKMVGAKRLTQIESVFGATFENLGGSVAYAVDRSQKDLPEADIPIEKSL